MAARRRAAARAAPAYVAGVGESTTPTRQREVTQVCSRPGCPHLVDRGRCPACRPSSSAAQGYGAEHRRWRAAVLARAGHRCEAPGCTERATVADHIVPLSAHGARLDPA